VRSFTLILLFACSPALRAQRADQDFDVCKAAGAEITRQGGTASPQQEFCIGYVYAFGRGVPRDMGAAVPHFRSAADRGYVPAQATLGLNYALGLGVAQNWAEAVRWYRKAADAGHGGAAANLGQCYQNGNGVPKDRNEAAKWYRFAMDHGDPHAPGLLVALNGAGPSQAVGSPQRASTPASGKAVYAEETLARMNLPPNMTAQQIWEMAASLDQRKRFAEAAGAFLKCSDMGNMKCTSSLGHMYDQGNGVPLDRKRAVWYLTRAANGGNRGAQHQLGVYWEEGEVLPQDMKKAMEWYMKSAQQGMPEGEARIGYAYEFGEMQPRSRQTAIEWLSRAAAQGDGKSAVIARLLSDPKTPAHFRDFDELDAYYTKLFQQQLALHSVHVSGGGGVGAIIEAEQKRGRVAAYYNAGNPGGARVCAETPSCGGH
jgi:TPR repeat protein